MNPSIVESWIQSTESLAEISQKTIRELQLEKLNIQLKRLKNRQGFYADLPVSLDSLEKLQELPFTTGEDIRRYANRMLLLSQKDIARVSSDSTSGTTGEVKRIFYSAQDRARTVSFFAAGISQFVKKGNTTGIAMPFSGAESLGELIAQAIYELGGKPVEIGVGKTWGEVLAILQKHKPDTYIGMPVLLLSTLRMAKHWGVDWSLQGALISADTVSDGIVTAIRGLFSGSLWTHYGLRECGLGGAVSCEAENGMHIRENDLLVEIVDEKGRPVTDGEYGEIVITTLHAQAMPLIRYRTGDRARISAKTCPCGSPLRRIADVSRFGGERIRRLDETVFSVSGIFDSRYAIEVDSLRIEVLTDGAFSEEEITRLIRTAEPTTKVFCQSREIQRKDKALYIGKRKIEG